jgi:2,6-dihydroxypseudooxynicotine hydrolase
MKQSRIVVGNLIPKEFVGANMPRMLADGVEYVDLREVVDSGPTDFEEWCVKWMEIASRYEELAELALKEQNFVTAGEFFWKSSLCNHYGQFMVWHNEDLKNKAAGKKVESYRRGATMFQPRAERIEIPFENTLIPGYFRMPSGRIGLTPLVILIGGLESTKEEYYAFENICLKRGLATLAFDGPGQGELLPEIKSRADFEKATSAVIDYVVKKDMLEGGSIGVLGRSLGGYHAARSAAFDTRIRACIAWGVVYDFTMWDKIPDGHKDGWTYTAGCRDWEEAKMHYASYSLEGTSKRIACPLYVLQGRLDNIFPAEQAVRLAKEAAGRTTLVIEESGTHCAHNLSHIVRPRMVDWLARELKSDSSRDSDVK